MLKKNFAQSIRSFPEKIIYFLMFLCAAVGLLLQLINKLTLNYPVTTGPFPNAYSAVLFSIFFLVTVHYLKPTMPKICLVLFSFISIMLSIVTTTWLVIGIESTPFPLVDNYLLSIDQYLHFNTLVIINWTFQHPVIHKIFLFCYAFILIQVYVLPILLGVLNKPQQMYAFFIFLLGTFLLTGIIYFLFPAHGPYNDLFKSEFPYATRLAIKEFYDIHHYLAPGGRFLGIISFPSLHIFWILMSMYVVKDIKWLFWSLFIINVLAFLSTLFLGQHYLVDVLASSILFFGVFVPLVKYINNNHILRLL